MGSADARLEVVAGKAAGTWIDIDDQLVIGRHAEGIGRLADDEEISRLHARVAVDVSGFCAIEDLGSSNGTYVNGLRLSAPQTLSQGDTIEIGATTLVVREVPGSAPSEAPADAAPPTTPKPPDEASESESASQVTPAVPRKASSAAMPALVEVPTEPASAAPSEPASAAVSEPAPAPPPLVFQVEVDFESREARLRLNDASEPVRFTFESGVWRRDPSTITDQGEPR